MLPLSRYVQNLNFIGSLWSKLELEDFFYKISIDIELINCLQPEPLQSKTELE